MADVAPTNEKLVARARRILMSASGCEEADAQTLLNESGMNVKTALVMALRSCSAGEARTLLQKHNGHIRAAAESR